jgi:hypothetical protein
MTRGAANAAGVLAAFVLFLAPLGSQHASALTASAAALVLLAATVHYARVVLLVRPAGAARATVAAWSMARGAACQPQPQRDPDAAGKPRPRAPGANPQTV